MAVLAWRLLDELPSGLHAEIAFMRWLFDRAKDSDGAPALARLKTLLEMGFLRGPGLLDGLMIFVQRLAESEHAFACKLAAAILDEKKLAALDEERLWTAVEPIPLDAPWAD